MTRNRRAPDGICAGALCVAMWLVLVLPADLLGQRSVQVTVVATTDVHGRVMHWDYVNDREAPWGLTRAATVIDSLRRIEGETVVLVDAGDFIQGNPFAAYYASHETLVHPVIDAYNVLGYDVVVPGNHEFNWGLDVLDRAMSGAQFRVVAANLRRPDRGNAPAYRETAVFDRGGVRVGVAGFTTPGAMVWDGDILQGQRRIERIGSTALRVFADPEWQRVDLRIALIHSGLDGASSYDTTGVGAENVAAQLAALPTPPHLVVVGHSHRTLVDSVINGVHFIQPTQWAQSVSIARVTLEPGSDGGLVVRDIAAEQISLANVPPQVAAVRRAEQAHNAVRTWVNGTLATVATDWDARYARAEDTPIIDFVNEVQRRVSGAEMSATAALNLGARFRQGELPRRSVMGLYPYENTLKVVQIDGATLREYLEHSATYYRDFEPGRPIIAEGVPGYDFDIVAGVDYQIDLSRRPGSRIRGLRHEGRPVLDDDVFSLALSSYRQAGGGGYAMVANLPVLYESRESIRDLLVAEAERMGRLETASYHTRSWRIVPAAAEAAVRAAFGGGDVAAERTILRVLATTDLYGALASRVTSWSGGARVGGAAALKAWMDSLETACDCFTLRLDGGNHLRGSLISDRLSGRPVVEVFNAIGYDAVTLGRDDLSWSRDTLAARAASSDYAWLVAGVDAGGFGFVQPWQVRERAGVRVGLIGMSAALDLIDPDARVTPTALAGIVQGVLPAIRAQQPDLVVVLASADAFCETDGSCRGALLDFVAALDSGAVDLVIGGHGDAAASQNINGMTVLLPGSHGLSIGVADLVVTGRQRRINTSVETVWADSVRADTGIVRIVASFDSLGVREVATLRLRLALPDSSEHGLGRLVADAYRNATRAETALLGNDEVKGGFVSTTATTADVYRVQPVQSGLVRVAMEGEALYAILEFAVQDGEPRFHVSGLDVEYDPSRPAGNRIRRVRFSDGREVRKDREVTMGMSAALMERGGIGELVGVPAEPVGLTDFDALSRYLQRLPSPVEAPARTRFRTTR